MNKTSTGKINGGYPLHTFEQLEEKYKEYISETSDLEKIKEAYLFVCEKHKGQFRKSGEPYYHHLLEVAYILASLRTGPATIISGLLHDVVEDTDVKIEEIEKRWGEEVAKIVDALTKIQRLKLSRIESEDFEAEDHRKIFIGMAKDIRVIIIKLADRLHNMRTLDSLSPERQIALSKETSQVFVPIAHRLGLDNIKCELADLCLKYLEPERYIAIQTALTLIDKGITYSMSYRHAKNSNGFPLCMDCSSFVTYCLNAAGYNVPAGAYTGTYLSNKNFTAIDRSNLKPGDVGLMNSSSSGNGANHIGMYLGTDSNGKEIWIECSGSGIIYGKNPNQWNVFRTYNGY